MVAAASVGTTAMFAGGYIRNSSLDGDEHPSATEDLFDSATGRWSTATLSGARRAQLVAAVGSQVVFAGSNVADVYDSAAGE